MDDRLIMGLIVGVISIIAGFICARSINGFMEGKYKQWSCQYQIGGYLCMNIAAFGSIFAIGNLLAVFAEWIIKVI